MAVVTTGEALASWSPRWFARRVFSSRPRCVCTAAFNSRHSGLDCKAVTSVRSEWAPSPGKRKMQMGTADAPGTVGGAVVTVVAVAVAAGGAAVAVVDSQGSLERDYTPRALASAAAWLEGAVLLLDDLVTCGHGYRPPACESAGGVRFGRATLVRTVSDAAAIE